MTQQTAYEGRVATGSELDACVAGAREDLVTARILLERDRLQHALIFCHGVLEKALKAHIVRRTNGTPPATRNLLYLLEQSGIKLDKEGVELMVGLNHYQLSGAHSQLSPNTPCRMEVSSTINRAESLMRWLLASL